MKRILLVNPFGIGDVLFSTPLIRALKAHGAERVDVLLGSRTEAVFAHDPYVDEIIPIHKDTFKQKSRFAVLQFIGTLLLRLRRKKYDLLVDLSLTREYAFWSQFVLGIPERIGFDFKGRGSFLTKRVPLPDGFSGRHVMAYDAELLELLGVAVRPELIWHFGTRDRALTNEKLGSMGLAADEPFWAVFPGGGASWGKDAIFKQWAPERMAKLVDFLAKNCETKTVLVMGGGDDAPLAHRFARACASRVIDATGKLSLAEAAAATARARCFIGNDGGPLHVAKAVGIPTISFFGPVSPEVYGPFPRTTLDAVFFRGDLDCRPCYKRFRYQADCAHRACLTELDVREVTKQLEENGFIQLLNKTIARARA